MPAANVGGWIRNRDEYTLRLLTQALDTFSLTRFLGPSSVVRGGSQHLTSSSGNSLKAL
jgi:hypothetical protein